MKRGRHVFDMGAAIYIVVLEAKLGKDEAISELDELFLCVHA